MDKLKERAIAFSKLLYIEYNIRIGRKGKAVDISIVFEKRDFHHLIGLQYLDDMPNLKRDREKIFDEIMSEKITYDSISKSHAFPDIEGRFDCILHIESLLDSNNLIFKYSEKANMYSRIKAEYLLNNKLENNDVYIFLDINSDGKHFCRSFFPKDKIDFTKNQSTYTLLYKVKVNKLTQSKIVQYDRLKREE